MKKVYVVVASESNDTLIRLYHKKENAMEDFEEMVDIAQEDDHLEILDITREECEDEIFAIMCTTDGMGFYYCSVTTREFEDEEE